MALTEIHRPSTTRILVVDDDHVIRAFCTKILNQAGYSTLGASDSSDAMWQTSSSLEPFDLLVVDVFLPISADLQLSPIQNVYPPVRGGVIFILGENDLGSAPLRLTTPYNATSNLDDYSERSSDLAA